MSFESVRLSRRVNLSAPARGLTFSDGRLNWLATLERDAPIHPFAGSPALAALWRMVPKKSLSRAFSFVCCQVSCDTRISSATHKHLLGVRAIHAVLPKPRMRARHLPKENAMNFEARKSFDGDGDTGSGTLCNLAAPVETIIGIRQVYRQRQDLLNAHKSLTLQIKAICRRYCGGSKTDADKVYRALMAGEESADVIGVAAQCLLSSRDVINKEMLKAAKECEREAKTLHVAPFVLETPGFGFLGLAQIVGEAGDLSLYGNPGKLWKRFGLAPFKGKAPSQWRVRGGLSKDEFERMGYSPRRRSVCYVIGDSLIKKQGPYRDVYLARKAYLIARAIGEGKRVLPAAKITKADAANCVSDIHIHRAAQMYMEKRLLRNLWRVWRGGSGETQP